MRRSLLVPAVLFLLALAVACGNAQEVVVGAERRRPGPEVTAPRAPGDGDGARPTSIVQLGDSIASGEGTLYGYEYDPHTRTWTGGNVNAVWPPPYPLCHNSPDAYGYLVADYFGSSLASLACTGATFANGISAPQTSGWETLRPAQFGNWATQTDLDQEYDGAQPDLVLVTLGADDLQFVSIVEQCIKNGYYYYFNLANLECVPSNPGSTIETDYFAFLPTLVQNYATLVDWIEARATAHGLAVPKVVFTNYPNPLPGDGAKCPDTSWLYPEHTSYLSGLVDDLNGQIEAAIEGLGKANVAVADVSAAYTPQGVSHIWCSDDPWAYGLSIYKVSQPTSAWSQAPFHPPRWARRAWPATSSPS